MNIRLSQKNAFKLGSDNSNGKKKSAQICKASVLRQPCEYLQNLSLKKNYRYKLQIDDAQ